YAWRTKVSVMKKIIVLYLANGMTWEPEFETFADWAFDYLMWCKLNLFKEKADALFKDEKISRFVRHNSPFKMVGDNFTYEQFATACARLGCRKKPNELLNDWMYRGKIERTAETTYRKT
ncbi:MAG: hypothetical protein HUK02_07265, partial [Bacteroidaceae bacterium]|nr:hypothetical protein [Bacteroidaceae bacterium]